MALYLGAVGLCVVELEQLQGGGGVLRLHLLGAARPLTLERGNRHLQALFTW